MKNFLNLNTFAILVSCLLLLSCASSKTAKVDPYTGDWEYVAETPQGDLNVTMSIIETEGIYTGSLTSEMGTVDMEDLKIEEGKLTTSINIQGYIIPISGAFEGNTFTGASSFDGNEMPINATKKTE